MAKWLRASVASVGLLSLGAALVIWLWLGWRMMSLDPPPALLSAVPWNGLLALGLTVAAVGVFASLGNLASHTLGRRGRDVLPRFAFAYLLGAALIGTVGSYISYVFLVPGIVFLAALVPVVIRFRKVGIGRGDIVGETPAPPSDPMRWIVVPFFLLIVLAAMAPSVESDGLRYHLPVVGEWLRAGRFVNIPYNANSNLPAMQSLLAGAIGGTSVLGKVYQLLNAFHGLALAIVCGELGRCVARSLIARRAGSTERIDATAATVCTLLAFGVPTVSILSAWPFSDVPATACLVAGIWVALPGVVRKLEWRLPLASLFLGAALATKISLLPLVAFVGFALVVDVILRRKRLVLRLALLGVPVLMAIVPWLAKSWVYHGNPVYPVAYGVFGGPEWSVYNDTFYKAKAGEKGMGHGLEDFLRSPVDITINWPIFESFNPGPAVLGLMLMALLVGLCPGGIRRWSFRAGFLCFVVLGWVVWFRTYQSVRFLLPQILLLLTLGAPGLLWICAHVGTRWFMVGKWSLLVVAIIGASWAPIYRFRTSHEFRVAVGLVGEELLLAQKFNAYPAVLWLNRNTEPGEEVFYIGEFRRAYATTYRPISSDWFDTPRILTDIRETETNADIYRNWRQTGIRYILLNQRELSLYEVGYFKPRFSEGEWERFEALRRNLLTRIVEEPAPGVYILEVPPEGGID